MSPRLPVKMLASVLLASFVSQHHFLAILMVIANALPLDDYEGEEMLEATEPIVPPAPHLFYSSTSQNHYSEVSIEQLLSSSYQTSERDFGTELMDQESTEAEDSQCRSSKAKVGRKEKEITRLLTLFQPAKAPEGKVKKEYLRVLVLRGFKRALRDVMDKVTPRKKVHGFDPGDRIASRKWGDFRTFVRRNNSLEALAPTENGPGTEGKAKKRSSAAQAESKTFNDKFCRVFFTDSVVRTAFRLYLNVVFSHEDLEDLSHRFKFAATGANEEEKLESWRRLKAYLYRGMFKELKLPDDWAEDS